MIEITDRATKTRVEVWVNTPEGSKTPAWNVLVTKTDTQVKVLMGVYWHRKNAINAINSVLSESLTAVMDIYGEADRWKQ